MFLQELLYLWNTRWRCLQTSEVPPGHDVDDPYQILCRYVKWLKIYSNLTQISKWRTRGSTNPDKINTHRFGMTGIHRHQYFNFLTDCSKVINKTKKLYLMIHRWCCSQLWHISSIHGVDEVYQVLF